MIHLLAALSGTHDLWYAAPLVVVISLVYAATRHESTPLILWRAGRFAGSIVFFMGLILLLLMYVSSRL